MRSILILLFVSLPTAHAVEPTQKEIDAIADLTIANAKNARVFVDATAESLKTLKKSKTSSKEKIADLERIIASESSRLTRLESADEITTLPFTFPPKVGEIGQFPLRSSQVLRIVDDNNVVVRTQFIRYVPTGFGRVGAEYIRDVRVVDDLAIWIAGVPTKAAVDRLAFDLPQTFKITGTKKDNAFGTILLAELLDLSAAKAEVKKRFAAIADEAKLTAVAREKEATAAEQAGKLAAEKRSAEKVIQDKADGDSRANSLLLYAKRFAADGNNNSARELLTKVIQKHPGTKAAKEAEELFKKLK